MVETESTEWLNRNPGQTKTEKGEEAKKGEQQEMTLSLSLYLLFPYLWSPRDSGKRES